jgi:hypothetical protein
MCDLRLDDLADDFENLETPDDVEDVEAPDDAGDFPYFRSKENTKFYWSYY